MWEGNIFLPYNEDGEIEYKYFIRRPDGSPYWENGVNRKLKYSGKNYTTMVYTDSWRSSGDPSSALLTDAFQKVVFRRPAKKAQPFHPVSDCCVRFQIRAPRIDADSVMAVLGSTKELGKWEPTKCVVMDDTEFPLWSVDVPVPADGKVHDIEYKFAIVDAKTKKILTNEDGFNRTVSATGRKGYMTVITEEGFRYPVGQYKAAGIAIPVFSLRSNECLGVGEFNDIIKLVDWASKIGLRLVQLLPINDTIASHTWVDTYPYSAISVHALHPQYLHIESIGKIEDPKLKKEMEAERIRLNGLPQVDYEAMMAIKFKLLHYLYEKNSAKLETDPDYQKFLKENEEWVYPYAVFSYLRDTFSTVDFRWWPRCSKFDREEVMKVVNGETGIEGDKEGTGFYLFLQYHLAKQMTAASNYAREHRIILKGDLPIGIYRYSCDAWINPRLYNMDCQAGAPPDAFAACGQNWGFPTYNWSEMAKDNYAWWRSRLTNMAKYFDAYRIDHILGFFRIWEIPYNSIQGLLGQFSPALAISVDELRSRGINFNYDRMCKPYIRGHLLANFVGAENVDKVIGEFLNFVSTDVYNMKPQFDTQRKIAEYVAAQIKINSESAEYYNRVKPGLMGLLEEVLFIEAPFSNRGAFSPRISMQFTYSFKEMDWQQQQALNDTYIHYYYHRQESLWAQQAMQKLPAIVHATNMLVCGEDLGMVPACVGPIMSQLGILSLNIQRMPKDPKKTFFHPADAPYLSVVSTSSHDMSNLRAWWQENFDETKKFYYEIMGHKDECPFFCEDWVAKEIINQHLYSPAMLAIFPVQDLLAMDSKLRLKIPEHERINVPANPHHYWRFRLHMSVDDLLNATEFNKKLSDMLTVSGRNAKY